MRCGSKSILLVEASWLLTLVETTCIQCPLCCCCCCDSSTWNSCKSYTGSTRDIPQTLECDRDHARKASSWRKKVQVKRRRCYIGGTRKDRVLLFYFSGKKFSIAAFFLHQHLLHWRYLTATCLTIQRANAYDLAIDISQGLSQCHQGYYIYTHPPYSNGSHAILLICTSCVPF